MLFAVAARSHYSMKRQTAKKNLGAQEPWVDFCIHKCDQDPLLTTSLVQKWPLFIVLLNERVIDILRFNSLDLRSINTKD